MSFSILIGEAAAPDLRLTDVEDADEWRSELEELTALQRDLTVELLPSEDLGVSLPEAAEVLRETVEAHAFAHEGGVQARSNRARAAIDCVLEEKDGVGAAPAELLDVGIDGKEDARRRRLGCETEGQTDRPCIEARTKRSDSPTPPCSRGCASAVTRSVPLTYRSRVDRARFDRHGCGQFAATSLACRATL